MTIKKELISKPTRAQLQKLTTANIAIRLLEIMKKHIGQDNAISRSALFRHIFKRTEKDTLDDWLRWEFIKRGMHLCRQRTKCFIASKRTETGWKYFVVNSQEDAQHYVTILEKNIKKMRMMQRRAVIAATEKWGSLPEWTESKQLR